MRLLGGEGVPREEMAAGAEDPRGGGPDEAASVARDEAGGDVGVRELRASRRHDRVTREGDRRAEADRGSLHRDDDRLFDVDQRRQQIPRAVDELIAQVRVGVGLAHHLEVATGRESLAGRGEHDRPGLLVLA